MSSLWEGLECFPAYGDEPEPAVLAGAAAACSAWRRDATGLVDHDQVGEAWKRSNGARTSIADLLFEELEASR